MNLLAILLNAEKMWEALPDGEKTAIIEAIDRLALKAFNHRTKAATPQNQSATPGWRTIDPIKEK